MLLTQPQHADWTKRAEHYAGLAARIIDQAHRRVIKGEKVAATDKIVSVFEPHTDIIVKDRRNTQFGYKLNLSIGKHGMVLDVVIDEGSPTDSTFVADDRAYPGKLPRQVLADAGYASRENISATKALGIKAVGLPKKSGMSVEEPKSFWPGSRMTGSEWIYKVGFQPDIRAVRPQCCLLTINP